MTQTQTPPACNAQQGTEPSPVPLGPPFNTPTPISTSRAKRSHDDIADDGPDDQDCQTNQLTPPADLPDNNKRPKTHDVDLVSSITNSETLETRTDGAPTNSVWPDVLYLTRAEDEKSEKSNYYYSDQKYNEWADPLKDDDRTPASLIEIVRDVIGEWQDKTKSMPNSMSKDQWREKDLHIKFGEDFTIKRQKLPLMRIQDPVCRSIIRFLIKYDPGQILTGNSMNFHWPWHTLMLYYTQIEELRDKIKNCEASDFRLQEADGNFEVAEIVRRIDVLLGQINDIYTVDVRPELQNHSTLRSAEFKKLWLLFKPGEEVFTRVNGELAAFIVLAQRNHEPGDSQTTQAPIKQLIVHVWSLRLVAGRLVRHMSQIAIDEYEDTRLIDTLPVFPCKYAGPQFEAQEQRQRLIDRGKRYFDIIKQPHAHMDHKGLTRDSQPRTYNGRVVIDPISYVKYGANTSSRPRQDFDWDWLSLRPRREKNSVHFDPLKPSQVILPEDNGGGQLWEKYNGGLDPTDPDTQRPGFLEDRDFLLLPRNIGGISLKDKQWETYDVDSLSEVVWGQQDVNDPFPGLILDDKKQKLIQANCRTAEARRLSPDLPADRIGGTGEGTIILLHGPPGVGKTYTVERIANYTKQPLLSLSGCDIGTMENSETKVQHWFDLAKAWDALILIDEADIFLTWRQPDNLERNFLVTTFLRTIESFPGTLFLTTNRIGQLDLAINSRIDIAIHFDMFDFESQKRLWLQYFREINKSAQRKGVYIKDKVINEFITDESIKENSLSGREIRNAFKQAIKIARCDSQIQGQPPSESFKLKLSHLNQAIGNCKEKTQHILNANRVSDESELAERRNERQHGLPPPNSAGANDRYVEA